MRTKVYQLKKLEGIVKKISYERRDYESVDEKSLEKLQKKISGTKGLTLALL